MSAPTKIKASGVPFVPELRNNPKHQPKSSPEDLFSRLIKLSPHDQMSVLCLTWGGASAWHKGLPGIDNQNVPISKFFQIAEENIEQAERGSLYK